MERAGSGIVAPWLEPGGRRSIQLEMHRFREGDGLPDKRVVFLHERCARQVEISKVDKDIIIMVI